ncbi:hypothetical protein [Bacillus horti]|uniref:Uncharacterized protein n=1 Tax=Caldalkalibacillus horti TaxID=77523 RepID=A0ABT9W1R7_9BACI|nr:hypothetical protein [Bacillus horti]MDQ0167203.1 hypothetical protein [Bacillus horti]
MRRKQKKTRKTNDIVGQYLVGVAVGLTVGLMLFFFQLLWQ